MCYLLPVSMDSTATCENRFERLLAVRVRSTLVGQFVKNEFESTLVSAAGTLSKWVALKASSSLIHAEVHLITTYFCQVNILKIAFVVRDPWHVT